MLISFKDATSPTTCHLSSTKVGAQKHWAKAHNTWEMGSNLGINVEWLHSQNLIIFFPFLQTQVFAALELELDALNVHLEKLYFLFYGKYFLSVQARNAKILTFMLERFCNILHKLFTSFPRLSWIQRYSGETQEIYKIHEIHKIIHKIHKIYGWSLLLSSSAFFTRNVGLTLLTSIPSIPSKVNNGGTE